MKKTPEETYDDQLRRCDHVPFLHGMLGNRFECLCGKTSIPIRDLCPSPACLCGRPKACAHVDPDTGDWCELPADHPGGHSIDRKPS